MNRRVKLAGLGYSSRPARSYGSWQANAQTGASTKAAQVEFAFVVRAADDDCPLDVAEHDCSVRLSRNPL